MAISQYLVGLQESHRRNRNCLHEIATGAKRPRNDNSGVHAINGKRAAGRPACFSVQGIFGGDGIRGAGFGEVGRQDIAGDGAERAALRALFHIDRNGDLRVVRRGIEHE